MAEPEKNKILRIIHDLRERQREKFDIQIMDFWCAVAKINEAYNPEVMTSDSKRIPLDYNNEALRYAYLVKYPIHAAVLQHFLSLNREHITSVLGDRDTVKICCLGGGPGSDVIGFAAEICELPEFCEKNYTFTIVDNMSGWKVVFDDLFEVADPETRGNLGDFLASRRVSHSFICDDLSSPTDETVEEIGTADISVLLKFVSVLDPNRAFGILKKLFSCMKPGALVVFIDNSGGPSQYVTSNAASECYFEQIGWSTSHGYFEKPGFEEVQWGEGGRNGIYVAMKMFRKVRKPTELSNKNLA